MLKILHYIEIHNMLTFKILYILSEIKKKSFIKKKKKKTTHPGLFLQFFASPITKASQEGSGTGQAHRPLLRRPWVGGVTGYVWVLLFIPVIWNLPLGCCEGQCYQTFHIQEGYLLSFPSHCLSKYHAFHFTLLLHTSICIWKK